MENRYRMLITRPTTVIGLLAVTVLTFPLTGLADHRRQDADAYYEYARVTHVEPITRIVRINSPREVCWNERVRTVREVDRHRHSSFTPTVLGGLLGGVVGNQFGGGRGKSALTVAGALLGASFGRDAGNRRHRPARSTRMTGYTTERRCEVEQVVHEEERIDGYRVGYRFHGRDYETRTDTYPGDRIRVRVEVDPVSI